MSRLRLRHVLAAWIILGVGAVVPLMQNINDPDIWWHLKTGQLIWASRAVPTTDPFSFTCFGEPWVAHEWLAQVIFYGIFALWGFIGLVVMKAVLASAMVGGMYLSIRRYTERQFILLPLTLVSALAVWRLWNHRPQMFSYLLLMGLLLLLEKPRSRRVWLVVPMFCIWANLHGVWAFGYVVMAVVLLDAAVASLRAGKPRDALQPVGVLALSLLAVMVSPQPLQRLLYPLSYFDGSIPANLVIEFRPPSLRNPMMAPYDLMLVALPASIVLGRKRMRWSQWVIASAMVFFSLKSMRHVPLFVIIAAPIIAMQIDAFLERKQWRLGARIAWLRELWPANLVLLLPLIFLLMTRVPRENSEEANVRADYYPVHACSFLLEEPQYGGGRVVNPYDWGGFLIFRLDPKYKVSIDGRADVHREHMAAHVRHLDNRSPQWREHLDSLQPDVIVWKARAPLTEELMSDSDWMPVYEDQTAVVFVRDR